MITILVKNTFQKELQKIHSIDRKYIIQKMESFAGEDDNLDIKKLMPKERSYYRLRVWKYRLIFQYTWEKEVTFFKVDKRDSVYFNI